MWDIKQIIVGLEMLHHLYNSPTGEKLICRNQGVKVETIPQPHEKI